MLEVEDFCCWFEKVRVIIVAWAMLSWSWREWRQGSGGGGGEIWEEIGELVSLAAFGCWWLELVG